MPPSVSSQLAQGAERETTFLGLLRRQFMHPKPLPPALNLAGQTAVVTGANTGLGFEAARQLLSLGLSRLIVAVRSEPKGEEAAATLRREFPAARIDVWLVDMASYDSITAFARRCADTLDRLDLALLNAGLQNLTYEVVASTHHETTFQVNYLSTALLSALLLPVLRAKAAGRSSSSSGPPRLIVVGSDVMYWAQPDKVAAGPVLPQFDRRSGYHILGNYAKSKMALMAFVIRLASHVSPDDVVVNVVNPGLTAGTTLSSGHTKAPWYDPRRYVFAAIVGLLARPIDVGASTYIDAAVVQGPESHGSFVSEWALKP